MSRALAQPVRISVPQIGTDGRGIIVLARDPAVTDGRIGDLIINSVSKHLFGPKTVGATLSAIWPDQGLIRGANGWYPVLSIEADGTRRVQQVDWAGGEGTKPDVAYVGASGLVSDIADGVDVRGAAGPQALITGLDAATEDLTDDSFISTAETDGDNEKRTAVEVFDLGEELVRRTVTHAEASTVRKNISTIRTNGFAARNDGGGAHYKRVDAEPSHSGKIRSQDRWTASGNLDSANGGWWEIDDRVLNDRSFGVKADGVTIDTGAVRSWFIACSNLKRRGYANAGKRLIEGIDQVLSGNIEINCHQDAVFKGVTSYQDFPGNGSQSSFTITDFVWFDTSNGVRADIINTSTGLVVDQLTAGVDYALSGLTLNLAGGSSPYGAPSTGQKLRVAAAVDIVTLRGSKSLSAIWRGGQFDGSLRGGSSATDSGSGLSFIKWKRMEVDSVEFYGATDYEAAWSDRISDSGLTTIDVDQQSVHDCLFVGWGDLGAYLSGNSGPTESDDGGNVSVYSNRFLKCAAGIKVVRRANGVSIFGNHFEECSTGVLNGITGGLDSGQNYLVMSNTFKRCGRRCVDLRAMASGAIVTENIIEDFGYNLDGVTPHVIEDGSTEPAPTAIYVSGCPGASVKGNQIRLKDWAGTNNQRGVHLSDTTYADESPALAIAIDVSGNYFSGIPEGIIETGIASDFSACRYEDNRMDDVTTPVTVLGTTTRYSYIDVATDQKWYGKGASTWKDGVNSFTPTLTLSGPTGTPGTPTVQRCSYVRHGDLVTCQVQVQNTITHSATSPELRIGPLPFTARNGTDAGEGGGSVLRLLGVVLPSDTVQITPNVGSGGTYVRLNLTTTPSTLASRPVIASDVPSGATLRVDCTFSYFAV